MFYFVLLEVFVEVLEGSGGNMENNNTAGDNSENVHADQDNNNSVLMVAPVDVRSERHV